MPIGDYPAGSYPAGADAIVSSTVSEPTLGQAPRFDPFDRAYVLAEDDSVEMTHPVMHVVAHLIGIPKGYLSHTPDNGVDHKRLGQATRATAQQTAQDVIADALRSPLANNDIEIVSVTAVTTPRWRGQVYTVVKNLRDPQARPVRFTAGASS